MPGTKEYLLLPALKAECPATGQQLDIAGADSLVAAQRACDAFPQCDFFSWDVPAAKATLCSGHEANFVKRPGYYTTFNVDAVVGVRSRGLQAKDYEVLTNYQAVCEPGQVLGEVRGVFTMDEAARRCNADPRCHFFGLSTSSGLPRLANTLWLCGGDPVFASRYGWIGAGKMRWMPPRVPGQDGLPGPLPAGVGDGALQHPLLLERTTQPTPSGLASFLCIDGKHGVQHHSRAQMVNSFFSDTKTPTPMQLASFLCLDSNIGVKHSHREMVNSFFAHTTTQEQLQAIPGEGILPSLEGFTFSKALDPPVPSLPDDADELAGQLRAQELERKMFVTTDDY